MRVLRRLAHLLTSRDTDRHADYERAIPEIERRTRRNQARLRALDPEWELVERRWERRR